MKLLVDLQAAQGPSGLRGIGQFALNLTRALSVAAEHDVHVLLAGGPESEGLLEVRSRLRGLLRHDRVHLLPYVPGQGSASRSAMREAAIASIRPDAVLLSSVFELTPEAPVSISQHLAGPPTAAVLYDLIPLLDLALYKPDPLLRREYQEGLRTLQRADMLLAISQFSRSEAQRLLPSCPPVRVVYGAGAELPATAKQPACVTTGGYALLLGLDEPRKNLRVAARAWLGLPASVRRHAPLVIAGTWPVDMQVAFVDDLRVSGYDITDVVFAGPVTQSELSWLYRHASVFIFPSLIEGLGLPPLEAMSTGTPTLIARTSSLRELSQDQASFFDPNDEAGLRQRLEQVLREPAARSHLVDVAQEVTSRFTWERTAAAAWAALAELVNESTTRVDTGGSLRTGETSTGASPLYTVGGDDEWRDLDQQLVEAPGVVHVKALPTEQGHELRPLLAPAVAVLAEARTQMALHRAGVTFLPMQTLTAGEAASEARLGELSQAVSAGDVLAHWALASKALSDQRADDALFARARPRSRASLVVASDVTIYQRTPFFSGIQRATRALHDALQADLTATGGCVLPVALGHHEGEPPHPDIARDPVLQAQNAQLTEVDWLLGVDLNALLAHEEAQLHRLRLDGLGVAVYVHDLLPHFHPEWWPSGAAETSFRPWARVVTEMADVILVNSVATARDLARYVEDQRPVRKDLCRVHLVGLGMDFHQHETATSKRLRDRKRALMVGTVEPRKGHDDVLDAFEKLWREGSDCRLTVVGRAGWLTDEVAQRMRQLEAGQPLFEWLQNVDDEQLEDLYASCTLTIVASLAEGYGLPVAEAALRGCPLVLRDIPVLREVAGAAARYFSAAEELVAVLRSAFQEPETLQAPSTQNLQDWKSVASRVLEALDGGDRPLAQFDARGWDWTDAVESGVETSAHWRSVPGHVER